MDLSDKETAEKMRRWLVEKSSLLTLVESFRSAFQATELDFLNFYVVTSPRRSPGYGPYAPTVRYWTYVFYIVRKYPDRVYFTFADSPLGIYEKKKLRKERYIGSSQYLFLGNHSSPQEDWDLSTPSYDEEALYYPLDWDGDSVGMVPLSLGRYQDLYRV